jgi:hypothetical protein
MPDAAVSPHWNRLRFFKLPITGMHFHTYRLFEITKANLSITEFIHFAHSVCKVFSWFSTFSMHLLYHKMP